MEIIISKFIKGGSYIPTYFIYPIYTAALGVVCLFIVPKEKIKKLAFWAILYGAIGDLSAIIVTGHVFKAGKYVNFGPFNFLGIPFFPLLAWSTFYLVYLHILPAKKSYAYLFSFTATGFSLMFSHVLQNIGILEWKYSQVLYPLGLYTVWHFLATYTFNRYFRYVDLYKAK